MRRPFPRWLTLAVATAILAPALLAAQTAAAPRFTPGPLLSLVAERLELSAAQKAESRVRLAAHRGEIERGVDNVVATRRALFAAIHAATGDEAAVRDASAAAAQAELELALVRHQLVVELDQLLEPRQRAELASLLGEGEALVDGLLARARVRWEAFLAS